eukprot:761772-Pyramimonas_sp.AAC.1
MDAREVKVEPIFMDDFDDDGQTKVRKPYTVTNSRKSWTDEEHNTFLEALEKYVPTTTTSCLDGMHDSLEKLKRLTSPMASMQ